MTNPDGSGPSATSETSGPGAGIDRRAALKNIGALAGSAPAVALLLTPSATRANGYGGSPCEDDRHSHCSPGRGHGNDRPGNGFGWGHEPGHGGNGFGWGHERGHGGYGPGGKWGKDHGKPRGRES